MTGASLGDPKVPFLIIGCASIGAAFLVLLLPETAGAKQFESLHDMRRALDEAKVHAALPPNEHRNRGAMNVADPLPCEERV